MKVAVVGCGAVGARAARQLTVTDAVTRVVCISRDEARTARVVAALGSRAVAHGGPLPEAEVDVAVLATPGSGQATAAAEALAAGAHVVSVTDDLDEVERLLALDGAARRAGRALVVGAGMAPGLSCLLARHSAPRLASLEEIHVAKFGTGGPTCARQHHRALRGRAVEWREGAWLERPAGTGRELCWFPDPVGAHDCYRAELPDAVLLHAAFPAVGRISARVAATRRDRLTARLPMLRRPHPEGRLGAVRVELRGDDENGGRDAVVLGAIDRPAVAAGAVAAVLAVHAGDGRVPTAGAVSVGDATIDAAAVLAELARRGVKVAVFEGAGDSAVPRG